MIREYIIKISDEIMEEEIVDRPQELVRCKNCKYGCIGRTGVDCGKDRMLHSLEWFCADGVRK